MSNLTEPKSRSRMNQAGDNQSKRGQKSFTDYKDHAPKDTNTSHKCTDHIHTRATKEDIDKEEENEDLSFATVSVILKFLYLLRILICLIPQHGYIQPDEFFQFTEPLAGSIFGSKVYIPWEFDQRFPLRNTLFPTIFSGSSFWFLSKLTSDPSAYWLMVLPRLLVTLFSLASDWAVSNLLWDQNTDDAKSNGDAKSGDIESKDIFRPSKHSSIGVCNVRLLFASSYICFTYLTHTFTNSIELVLFSVLIMLTLSYHKMTSKDGTAHGLVLGAILALGLFNRPTFLIFAFYPLIWSVIGHPKIRISYQDCIKKTLLMAPTFILLSTIAIISDTIYYSDIMKIDLWTVPYTSYLSVIKDNLVLTPINFITYNSKTSNLSNHGLHPRYFHFLINIPILFGVLTFPFYMHAHKFFLSLFFLRYKLRSSNLDMNMMIASTLMSIAGLSLFPHQEARFLIPLLVTFSYMYRRRVRVKIFIIFWLIFNASLVYMFGFVHQAGVTKSIFALHDIARANGRNARAPKHFIFAAMYLPPQHLLNIKESDADISIYDYSVQEFPDAVKSHFEVISRSNLTHGLISYLVAPSAVEEDLMDAINSTRRSNGRFRDIKLLASFFPHFSHETLEHSIDALAEYGWRKAFSMNIWRIKIN